MELQCNLTGEQHAVYDAAVQLWQSLRQGLAAALVQTTTTSRELWKPFWSAQQRFFKLLCVSLKASSPSPYSQEGFTSGHYVPSHLIWVHYGLSVTTFVSIVFESCLISGPAMRHLR